MRMRCCDLGDSSYCPENLGIPCMVRLIHNLNPEGGNEEKIAEINRLSDGGEYGRKEGNPDHQRSDRRGMQ